MPIFYVILHTDVYKKHKEMLEIRTITVNPIEENCYILYDKNKGNSCWVVDCGAFFPQEKAEILNFLQKLGLYLFLLYYSSFEWIFPYLFCADFVFFGKRLEFLLDMHYSNCVERIWIPWKKESEFR